MQLIPSQSRSLFVAADLGAGNIKLRTSKKRSPFFSMPSLICRVEKKDVEEGDRRIYSPDVFHIGDEEFWYVGTAVSDRRMSSENPGDDANLKVSNAPYFLMAALILGGYVEEGVLNKIGLVLSHQDPDAMGQALRQKIEGERCVSHAGKTYRMVFHLPEQGVYREGAKIVCSNSKHGILDLGYLTALYTRRSNTGTTLYSSPVDAGINRLVTMTCEDAEFRSKLGGVVPDRDRVVDAIFEASKRVEAGETKVPIMYRNKGRAIDIKGSYSRCLLDWLKVAARVAVEELHQESGSSFVCVAIGGGTKLPGVDKALGRLGISIYSQSDPIFANCDSLYRSVVATAKRDQAFEGWFKDEDLDPDFDVDAVEKVV